MHFRSQAISFVLLIRIIIAGYSMVSRVNSLSSHRNRENELEIFLQKICYRWFSIFFSNNLTDIMAEPVIVSSTWYFWLPIYVYCIFVCLFFSSLIAPTCNMKSTCISRASFCWKVLHSQRLTSSSHDSWSFVSKSQMFSVPL